MLVVCRCVCVGGMWVSFVLLIIGVGAGVLISEMFWGIDN